MARTILTVLGLTSLALAQTTLKVNFMGFGEETVDGSVVGVSKATTTLALSCQSDTPSEQCNMNDDMQITYGSSTQKYKATFSGENVYTYFLDCKMKPKDGNAECAITLDGQVSGSSTKATMQTTFTDYTKTTAFVVVTAGANQLSSSEDADDDGSQSTGATAAETTAAGTTVSDASGSDTEATSSNSDNAAGPAATHNAVVAGFAAVVGGAAILL